MKIKMDGIVSEQSQTIFNFKNTLTKINLKVLWSFSDFFFQNSNFHVFFFLLKSLFLCYLCARLVELSKINNRQSVALGAPIFAMDLINSHIQYRIPRLIAPKFKPPLRIRSKITQLEGSFGFCCDGRRFCFKKNFHYNWRLT